MFRQEVSKRCAVVWCGRSVLFWSVFMIVLFYVYHHYHHYYYCYSFLIMHSSKYHITSHHITLIHPHQPHLHHCYILTTLYHHHYQYHYHYSITTTPLKHHSITRTPLKQCPWRQLESSYSSSTLLSSSVPPQLGVLGGPRGGSYRGSVRGRGRWKAKGREDERGRDGWGGRVGM